VSRDYLTVADVLGMHIALISRYGGASGVRDPGGLRLPLQTFFACERMAAKESTHGNLCGDDPNAGVWDI
jgi:hypothetical protein